MPAPIKSAFAVAEGAAQEIPFLKGWMSLFEVAELLNLRRQTVHHLLWKINAFDVNNNVRAVVTGRERWMYIVRISAVKAEYDRRVATGRLPDAPFPYDPDESE